MYSPIYHSKILYFAFHLCILSHSELIRFCRNPVLFFSMRISHCSCSIYWLVSSFSLIHNDPSVIFKENLPVRAGLLLGFLHWTVCLSFNQYHSVLFYYLYNNSWYMVGQALPILYSSSSTGLLGISWPFVLPFKFCNYLMKDHKIPNRILIGVALNL